MELIKKYEAMKDYAACKMAYHLDKVAKCGDEYKKTADVTYWNELEKHKRAIQEKRIELSMIDLFLKDLKEVGKDYLNK